MLMLINNFQGHRTGSHTALFEKDRDFYSLPPNGEPTIVCIPLAQTILPMSY